MARQLNWIVSGAAGAGVVRNLRSRLAATTILAVVPLLGYGRQAYAACVPGAPPTFICSGTETTQQTINADNADVSVDPGFSVITGDTNGILITGDGHLRFTDENAPPTVISGAANGLRVISSNVAPDPSGGITITTNGTVTGGAIGIVATHSSGGDLTIIANGEVTGMADVGIRARNYSDDLTITTGAGSDITGGNYGIFARNYGTGAFELTVDGEVTGTNSAAIYASNDGTDLTITTGAQSVVTGGYSGIVAVNRGEGDLEVEANGEVNGHEYEGIFAYNSEDSENLTVTTGAASAITGDDNGIHARNFGGGDLTITANGEVTGENEDGIHALNVNGPYYNEENNRYYIGGGGNLTITTGAQSVVTGFDDGIEAINLGNGNLEITASGQVTGEDGDGIFAYNSEEGGNLTVTTGAGSVINAYFDGIDAENQGAGNLEITVNGQVTTEDDNGIEADNYGIDLTIVTGAGSVISAGDDGINAAQYGAGNLEITANGDVEGRGDDGIYAENYGQNLTVTTGAQSVVTGVDDGIDARHYGDGNFEITVNGSVTGFGSTPYDPLGLGIEAFNYGDGDTVIKVGAGGLAQGYYAGIGTRSEDGQDIEITNDGTVRNLSAESYDRAIVTYGGATDITNTGDLIGTVRTDLDNAYDDTLDNAGFWNMAEGTSEFGDGDDEVTNTGTLRAANDPTLLEETFLLGVETFDNDGGLISLVDGQEGDFLRMTSEGGPIEYTGTDGRLAVDAALGPGLDGFSDQLFIDGNTDGNTLVHVNVVNASGANTDGIPVVIVNGGTTSEEDFDLDGPLNAGFFTWDLRLDDLGGSFHELFTTGVGVGASEFAAGITSAQEVWHQTMGSLLHRQADLRSLLGGTAVTPVADYGEPVAPTPVAHITPGFWMKGVGAYIERDDEEDGFVLDRKQTIWGGMAGFDFGSESVGSAWLFGIFGGYLVSDLDFDKTNTEWTYEGPTAGAYATYLNDAFYADLTVKADFLDIDIDPEDLAPASDDADTDALNIGGRIDTGYKFGRTLFIEPQASLAVVHTEIDDVDIFGGTVEFDDETSIRGRLGLRLGFDHTAETRVVYSSDVTASVWEEFSGDNNVDIVDAGVPDFGASDDPGATFGDVAVGFSVAAPDGWSGFLRANYLFGTDYEAVSGNAGVRWAW